MVSRGIPNLEKDFERKVFHGYQTISESLTSFELACTYAQTLT